MCFGMVASSRQHFHLQPSPPMFGRRKPEYRPLEVPMRQFRYASVLRSVASAALSLTMLFSNSGASAHAEKGDTPVPQPAIADDAVRFANNLLGQMTLDEKIGQM